MTGSLVQTGAIHGGLHLYSMPPSTVVPHQLPAAPQLFVGRADELAALDDAVACLQATPVSLIAGAGGIGKTALALHWAHRRVDRFPDGQLYVNLRGFDPSGDPVHPESAVRGFLHALGINSKSIPTGLDNQSALYRSLLADKRILIVLDNARNTRQVVPLLPGSPTCMALVTSRDHLTGLINLHGARRLPLDAMGNAEARTLLTGRLGAQRLNAEPHAVDELLAYCDGFPLALSIVAGQAAAHPDFPLSALADELHDTPSRLNALNDSDPASSLPAALRCSFSALPLRHADVFRHLGLATGPDISLHAIASLNALPLHQAREALRGLEQASLIHQHAPHQYRIHDLIRLGATEQAQHDLPEDIRKTALRRLVDFYVHTAANADRQLNPSRELVPSPPLQRNALTKQFKGRKEALEWFHLEHDNLVAASRMAARNRFYEQAWHLPWNLTTFLYRQGYWSDLIAIHLDSLTAGDRIADSTAKARSHRILASTYMRLGHEGDALNHAQQAIDLFTKLGDHIGRAGVKLTLGLISERRSDFTQALEYAADALEIFRSEGNRQGEIRALSSLSWNLARTGSHPHALMRCLEVLVMTRELKDAHGEAHVLDTIGYCHHRMGNPREAAEHYGQSIDKYQDAGDWFNMAGTLGHLGDLFHGQNDHNAARSAWARAEAIFERLKHPDLAKIQRKLRDISAH